MNPTYIYIYFWCLLVFYISNKFEEAIKDYTESIRLDDSFLFAHVQLGVAQYKTGSVASAMATFKNTLKKFPVSSDVHNYYGELVADQQDFDQAIDIFTKAIELDPKNPLPYINKALLTFQVKAQVDEAIGLCKKALEGKVAVCVCVCVYSSLSLSLFYCYIADPACDAAVATLGQLYLEHGEPIEALKCYELAMDLARTESELEHAISYVEATRTQIK